MSGSHHHGHHGHHHHHQHGGGHSHAAAKNIGFAFFLNASFVVVEIIGGLLTGSVAILADAVHDLGDTISLGLSWLLQKKAGRERTKDFTYGYARLSLLSAFISALVIALGSIVILVAAIPRLTNPGTPHGTGMFFLALLGIFVNGWAALRLSRGETMNEKILLWHYIEDVLGWVAVLVGSLFVALLGWAWVDPLLAIGIACFVLWNIFKGLKSTTKLFLQSAPDGFSENEFTAQVKKITGVKEVHDLHIWSLDGNQHVLSLHIELAMTTVEPSVIKSKVRTIAAQMGHFHLTIELEQPSEQCKDRC